MLWRICLVQRIDHGKLHSVATSRFDTAPALRHSARPSNKTLYANPLATFVACLPDSFCLAVNGFTVVFSR